jgi:F-box domain
MIDLPNEIWQEIYNKLDLMAAIRARAVSKLWANMFIKWQYGRSLSFMGRKVSPNVIKLIKWVDELELLGTQQQHIEALAGHHINSLIIDTHSITKEALMAIKGAKRINIWSGIINDNIGLLSGTERLNIPRNDPLDISMLSDVQYLHISRIEYSPNMFGGLQCLIVLIFTIIIYKSNEEYESIKKQLSDLIESTGVQTIFCQGLEPSYRALNKFIQAKLKAKGNPITYK